MQDNDKKRSAREATKLTSLCLDARMYRHSGIGVYILQQIAELKKDPTIALTLLVTEAEIPAFEGIPQILFKANIYSLKEQILYPFKIPACDIFWCPHYNVPVLPVKAKKRWVTIHDVYHLRYSHTLGLVQRVYARICFFMAAKWSDKIFTVSHFSKKELLSFFNVASKIEVVHNRVETKKFSQRYSAEKTKTTLQKYRIEFPYILFVGNVKPHKNLITLIRAFEQVEEKINPVKLVVVGKQTGFITEDNEVSRYLNEKQSFRNAIHFTDEVMHEELPILYQQARLFVFPSLYEGFGYPPLEAVAAGARVLCSNAGPMPEVCGEQVTYFDPNDIDALATLILSQLNGN